MIYAVGDIHGRFDLLDGLYQKILKDITEKGDKNNVIVFVGDYIDRGHQNVKVLDFMRHLQDVNTPDLVIEHIKLRGNHEEIFKYAMKYPFKKSYVSMWTNNGGITFLREVDYDFDYFVNCFPWDIYVNWMDSHLDDYYETEDYVFVHGGLDVRITDMAKQSPEYLQWARHMEKDHYKDYPKMVIHGHTPAADPLVDANRIDVDTSWSYSKYPNTITLTAVALNNRNNGEHYFLTESDNFVKP
jgi:Calcineurin-like phosphoesterase.